MTTFVRLRDALAYAQLSVNAIDAIFCLDNGHYIVDRYTIDDVCDDSLVGTYGVNSFQCAQFHHADLMLWADNAGKWHLTYMGN